MVRGGARNRGGGRRGRNRRGRARWSRAVRGALSAPRERVAPRRVIRTGPGHGTVSWNSLRRLTLFPRKVVSRGPAPSNSQWWIQSLKWVGSIVMQLITIALTREALDDHRRLHEVPDRYEAGSAVVGAVQSMLLGPQDLISQSPLSKTTTNESGNPLTSTHFRQARIMHVRITLLPSASLTNRGGQIAMAVLPFTIGEDASFVSNGAESEKWTFDDVCRLPNAVVKTATAPISATWSPRVGDRGYSFTEVGYPGELVKALTHSDYVLRVVTAYMDMSSDTRDVSADYSLSTSAFEMVIDGRVEMREISDWRGIRSVPETTRPYDQVTVADYGTKYLITDFEYIEGVLYHNRPLSADSVCDDVSLASCPL